MIRILFVILASLTFSLPARAADLGTNLSSPSDWGTQQAFIDVMKTARHWIGHKPDQWGGMWNDELVALGVFGENGWPTRIPDELESIGTILLTDLPEEASVYAGRYVLTYEGDGSVEVGGRGQLVAQEAGRLTFDFTPGGSGVEVLITATNPDDPVRNIRVTREEWLERLDAGEVFSPLFLESLQGFSTLRFMDWMQTNDSTLSSWDDRPRVDDYTWNWRGVPISVMLSLSELIGADPWFTLPHLADDDFVRNFAQEVHEGLPEGRVAYVEFSNEVWNWQFSQSNWAEAAAQERWGEEYRWMEYYGVRAAEVADIWSEVFAADRDRLKTVIATQTGWQGLEGQALEAPLYVAEAAGNRPPHEAFDAYAITGYFGYALGTERRAPMVKNWMAGFPRSEAIDRAIDEVKTARYGGEDEESLHHLIDELFPYHARIASRYGLELVGYEGGTHVVGIGVEVNDDELTEFLIELNYSERMGELYARLFDGWEAVTDGPLVLFTDTSRPSKWGSWGNNRYHGDENPRATVIKEELAQ